MAVLPLPSARYVLLSESDGGQRGGKLVQIHLHILTLYSRENANPHIGSRLMKLTLSPATVSLRSHTYINLLGMHRFHG